MKFTRLYYAATLAGFAIVLTAGATVGIAFQQEQESVRDHHQELLRLLHRVDKTMLDTCVTLQKSASRLEHTGSVAVNLAQARDQCRDVILDIDRILALECDCPSDCTSGAT